MLSATCKTFLKTLKETMTLINENIKEDAISDVPISPTLKRVSKLRRTPSTTSLPIGLGQNQDLQSKKHINEQVQILPNSPSARWTFAHRKTARRNHFKVLLALPKTNKLTTKLSLQPRKSTILPMQIAISRSSPVRSHLPRSQVLRL